MKSAFSFLFFFCIQFFAPVFSNSFASGSSLACSGPAQGEHKGLPIYHVYGPCSELRSQRSYAVSADILARDQLRVDSLNTLAVPNRYADDELKAVPIMGKDRSIGDGNFVVNVGFGTPSGTFNMTLDTGSDVTWIKCKKCSKNNGNKLQNAIFNPANSSTFSNCSYDCNYNIQYFDHSYAAGTWAFDTLTIPSYTPFPKFRFLCSDHNKGFSKVDGLLGLGLGDYSLVSQTSTEFDKVFCYCLPSEKTSSGYVLFGSEARQTCKFTSLTPLLSSQSEPNKYFVNLMSITIGNKTLDVSYAASSWPGAMLDSGTVITRLPQSTYSELRDTFKDMMMSYTIARRPSKEQVLDTCYNLAGGQYDTLKIPNVVLNFENVKVALDKSQILWKEDGKSSVYCLAFSVNKGDNVIIGNQQQRKLNVMYDVQTFMVGIQSGNCGE